MNYTSYFTTVTNMGEVRMISAKPIKALLFSVILAMALPCFVAAQWCGTFAFWGGGSNYYMGAGNPAYYGYQNQGQSYQASAPQRTQVRVRASNPRPSRVRASSESSARTPKYALKRSPKYAMRTSGKDLNRSLGSVLTYQRSLSVFLGSLW